MGRTLHKDAEEARNQFSDLLVAAEEGCSTVITRQGRAAAALIPFSEYARRGAVQESLIPLRGSGRGLWSADSRVCEMRGDWRW